MTVTYTAQVATSKGFSNFLLLLARWRGSIYKLVWCDLIVFLMLYLLLAIFYRYVLNDSSKIVFEGIVNYCNSYVNIIPLSFVLGFFVTIVMTRWWAQYTTIPWPDSVAILVSAHIQGEDDRARAMRRTVLRYVCLCQVIVFTMISPRVKKRFPTYIQIIEAGLLLENEKNIIDELDRAFPYYPKHWMPIVWAASIVMRARREGKIRDDYAVKSIIDELNKFRGLNGFLLYYDWVSVPLVYTQVVTLATYAFFLASVVGQQWTMHPSRAQNNSIDKYFPVFTTLQFFFYMGWLKVAESLINPFGDDDDDFDLNWMIDRNLTISYLIVDEMHQNHPDLVKDQYWDEIFPSELPYANESQRQAPPEPSTARLDYTKSQMPSEFRNPQKSRTGSSGNDHVFIRRLSRRSVGTGTMPSAHIGSRLKLRPTLSRVAIAAPRRLGMQSSRVTFESVMESDDDGSREEVRAVHKEPRDAHSSQTIYDAQKKLFESERKATVDATQHPTEPHERSSQHTSLNFEELIEVRNRERLERMRNRFNNLRSTTHPTAPGQTVYLFHAPPSIGSERLSEEEESQEEQLDNPQLSQHTLSDRQEQRD